MRDVDTTPPLGEIERLENRIKKLADEKAYAQLLIRLLERLNPLEGMDAMLDGVIYDIVDTIGGTNITVYYWVQQQLHYVDFLGRRGVLIELDDAQVGQCLEEKRFIEVTCEAEDALLRDGLLPQAYTWTFPLLCGEENIGAIKLENIHLNSAPLRNYLPIFFNHVALILSGEIRNQLRQQAETALLAKSEELDRYFNNALDLFCIADLNGYFRKLNPAWEHILGYSVADLEGRLFTDYIHPDDLASTIAAISTLTSQVPISNFVNRYRHRDGSYRWIEWHSQPQGELIYAAARDITARRLIEEQLNTTLVELAEQKSRLQTLLDTASDGVHILDPQGNLLQCSNSFAQMLGYTIQELKGFHVSDWDAHFPRSELTSMMQQLIEKPSTFESRHRRKDGSCIDVEINACGVTLNGQRYLYGSSRDITERKRAEEVMRLSSLVFQNSSEGMTITDLNGTIITVNPAFTSLTGYSAEEVVGRNPSFLKSGRHDAEFYRMMWESLKGTGHWEGEIWNRRKDGEIYAEWLSINTIYDKEGQPKRHVGLFSDITKRKLDEELIWRQANFDPLSGLPNRHMFHDRLRRQIKESQRTKGSFALMYIDLDEFKAVNDTLGHDMGDQLLKEAALRLQHCIRETDIVARLGGDEFTIIIGDLSDYTQVDRVAGAILETLNQSFTLKNETVYVSASIGITLYPDDAKDIDSLLKNADQAMYSAKKLGRNRFCFFTPEMQEATLARVQVSNDLRLALSEQQFQLYYQPIIDLSSGRIRKAEALIRWQHPSRGMVNPADFIPIAEETGLIVELGNWIFYQASQQALLWRQAFDADFQISINKSPLQFQNETVTNRWLDHLQQIGLAGDAIVIEITEGLLLDVNNAIVDRLLRYRDALIQIAIDDFGTGYSSLAYLQNLDIDYLKIDRAFINKLEGDPKSRALCNAIIVMAHELGLKVIAEGVETQAQRDFLTTAKCDYGQGYLFSKPIPSTLFTKLISVCANCL